MKVPLLDLRSQYATIREDALAALTRVCESQALILGPEVEGLERELAAMLQVKHAVGVSSGSDALLIALMALGVGPGDEVITSAYSFFASAGSISRLGATPVMVDIDPTTYNVAPLKIAAAITTRTKAIMPVHLFGLSADLQPILDVAAARGIPVVEDAAQAIGARYHDRVTGGLGTMGCFSFYPTKNLGAFGDGGLVTTNDDAIAYRLKILRNHGGEARYYHKIVGGNFRIDALQAAVLRVKAPHLAKWTEGRRANAKKYDQMFKQAGLAGRLTLPIEPAGYFHIFNQYIVRAPDRDALRAHLTSQGVGTEVYYPVPLHRQECFADLEYKTGDLPEAERAAKESLALPIYPELTTEQLQYVVDAIAGHFKKK
jgi:dTDP-4-amino-4,6-dideoxygalactose transaminase